MNAGLFHLVAKMQHALTNLDPLDVIAILDTMAMELIAEVIIIPISFGE